MASLRERKRINYKLMHEGVPLPKDSVIKSVLPDTFIAERLIKRKENPKVSSSIIILLNVLVTITILSNAFFLGYSIRGVIQKYVDFGYYVYKFVASLQNFQPVHADINKLAKFRYNICITHKIMISKVN